MVQRAEVSSVGQEVERFSYNGWSIYHALRSGWNICLAFTVLPKLSDS